MEDEPGIFLNLNGERFEATRANTSLFRFMGNLALYNHVFIVTDEEEGKGTYIFNQHPTYSTFETYMIANHYPLHDYLQGVAECDVDAFEKMVKQTTSDIGDYVPDDWDK